MDNPTRTTHPMVIVAAAAVTIASLVAIASFAGWLPGKNAGEAVPTEQTTTAPAQPDTAMANNLAQEGLATPEDKAAAQPKPAPTPKPASKKSAKGPDYAHQSNSGHSSGSTTHVSNNSGSYAETSQSQSQTCHDCGTVENVREVKHEGQGTGLGAISGGVIGGLLGNQVGGGKGKTVGAVVGAVGGAYAGNAVEKNVRSTKSYEITVRFDDGNTRVYSESQPPALRQGDRVRMQNGQLSRL